MLRKRKEPKAKRSIAAALLRDMQGTAAEKLAAFAKLRARGAFDGMDRRELLRIENMLRCGKLIAISAVGEPLSRFWHGPTSGQNSIMICGPMTGTARL